MEVSRCVLKNITWPNNLGQQQVKQSLYGFLAFTISCLLTCPQESSITCRGSQIYLTQDLCSQVCQRLGFYKVYLGKCFPGSPVFTPCFQPKTPRRIFNNGREQETVLHFRAGLPFRHRLKSERLTALMTKECVKCSGWSTQTQVSILESVILFEPWSPNR